MTGDQSHFVIAFVFVYFYSPTEAKPYLKYWI